MLSSAKQVWVWVPGLAFRVGTLNKDMVEYEKVALFTVREIGQAKKLSSISSVAALAEDSGICVDSCLHRENADSLYSEIIRNKESDLFPPWC